MLYDYLNRPLASATGIIDPEYEGATFGKRLSFWGLSGSGPNGSVSGGHNALKYRARNLRRNNPIVSGGVDSYVSNLVGTDISPSWDLDNPDQKQELQEGWERSVHEMDYYGCVDFYGQQEQAASGMIVDGEMLGRMVVTRRYSGMFVPFQVQNLESDHLDVHYNDIAPNGNEIRMGLEWKNGRRAAYHLWSDHPGEQYLSSGPAVRKRINASDIVHIFRPLRAGQQRGGSFLAPIITKLREIDQYDDAEVVRKKCAAMWQPFFINTTPGAKQVSFPSNITLEPGVGVKMPQGWEVQFSNPADVGPNYEMFMRVQFRVIAKGLGITYEQLTGDLDGVSFSSIRAGLIEFRRLAEMIRARTLVAQYTRPIVLRWLHVAMLSGVFKTISLSEYLTNPYKFQKISFIPQAWDYVNPVDDRVAEQMDMRNGLVTRDDRVRLRGGDADRVDRMNAQRNAKIDGLGLIYDSDPRHTAKSGAIQKAELAGVGGSNK